jgi:hypothetical protein
MEMAALYAPLASPQPRTAQHAAQIQPPASTVIFYLELTHQHNVKGAILYWEFLTVSLVRTTPSA